MGDECMHETNAGLLMMSLQGEEMGCSRVTCKIAPARDQDVALFKDLLRRNKISVTQSK